KDGPMNIQKSKKGLCSRIKEMIYHVAFEAVMFLLGKSTAQEVQTKRMLKKIMSLYHLRGYFLMSKEMLKDFNSQVKFSCIDKLDTRYGMMPSIPSCKIQQWSICRGEEKVAINISEEIKHLLDAIMIFFSLYYLKEKNLPGRGKKRCPGELQKKSKHFTFCQHVTMQNISNFNNKNKKIEDNKNPKYINIKKNNIFSSTFCRKVKLFKRTTIIFIVVVINKLMSNAMDENNNKTTSNDRDKRLVRCEREDKSQHVEQARASAENIFTTIAADSGSMAYTHEKKHSECASSPFAISQKKFCLLFF
ncbi:hypothetical protein RFI_28237, partial [Reticulomyxa filosa]